MPLPAWVRSLGAQAGAKMPSKVVVSACLACVPRLTASRGGCSAKEPPMHQTQAAAASRGRQQNLISCKHQQSVWPNAAATASEAGGGLLVQLDGLPVHTGCEIQQSAASAVTVLFKSKGTFAAGLNCLSGVGPSTGLAQGCRCLQKLLQQLQLQLQLNQQVGFNTQKKSHTPRCRACTAPPATLLALCPVRHDLTANFAAACRALSSATSTRWWAVTRRQMRSRSRRCTA